MLHVRSASALGPHTLTAFVFAFAFVSAFADRVSGSGRRTTTAQPTRCSVGDFDRAERGWFKTKPSGWASIQFP